MSEQKKNPHKNKNKNKKTSLPINGYWSSFPGIKRPGCEVDHSPPSNAEIKNEWSYTSAPLYAFMAWTDRTPYFTFTYQVMA
jgi:hypothetical protein